MQKGFRIFSVTLAVILAIYFTWADTGRQTPEKNIRLHLDSIYTIHTDAGKGNIVGINPYMTAVDYASKGHFYDKLDAYLQSAEQKGWLNKKTLVVFPEYIGAWLVVADEKTSIYSAPTATKALTTFVGSNFFSYLRAWFTTPDEAEDKVKYGVFASKGNTMARLYREVFSELAKKYKVTIAGGSILLPNPEIRKNRILIRKGPLYNVSVVFNPDGSLQPKMVKKAFPTADEQPFIASCPPAEIPVYDLPAGKTAVLICADSWFPESYAAIRDKNPFIVVVPSYTQKNMAMQEPWAGYSGFGRPADTDSTDIGRITLRDAWIKYTLPGRIKSSGATYGMNVSLRGNIWDLGSDGEFIAVSQNNIITPPATGNASMMCLWIQ